MSADGSDNGYWMMSRAPFADSASLRVRWDDPHDEFVFWSKGDRFAKPPIEPIEAYVEKDYEGRLPTLTLAPICLMSRALADVLVAAGVDNLDLYRVEITDHQHGTKHYDQVAFNLVGKVAAADLSSSRYVAQGGPMISVEFDRLALATDRIHGLLMFRLAEAVSGIVVHERIRQAVRNAGIQGVQFLAPSEWVS